ncbi:MAG TPA: PHP domain-containing protein [Clostridiaceae bacterium]|nr:PHP domain-containing protein [Clostridiaceae bacterium]
MQFDRNTKVDLHLHTTASDGTWQPEELIEELIKSDIKIFSVTDHDSTDSVTRTGILALEHNLKFIPGVEITTSWGEITPHILGYGIDAENPHLSSLLENNRCLLEKKDTDSIKYLESRGYDVSMEEYEKFVDNPALGGWKAVNYAKYKKLCSNHLEFFKLFEGYEGFFKKINYCPAEEAIKAIKDAGGIPVLAHPGADFYGEDYQKVIHDMIDNGIMGLECYHPDNSREVTEYSLKICKKKGLLITTGSDCHGGFVSSRKLGNPPVTLDMLNLEGLL